MAAAVQWLSSPGMTLLTMRCTTARGAGWSSASSGRTKRRKGAQRLTLRQASEGVMSTRPSVRSGLRMPTSIATRPPMLWPSTWVESSSSASTTASTQRAKNRAS
jgi:hypothetical protein